MTLFISGRPSNRAHFPYQVGLHGNSSPPDPLLSLPARRVSRPATAQLQRIRVNVADQAVASSSAPTCASLASRPFSPRQGRAVLTTSFFSSTEATAMSAPSLLFSTASSTKPGHCCSTLSLPGTLPHPAAILLTDA
jgi:hypothetical protein